MGEVSGKERQGKWNDYILSIWIPRGGRRWERSWRNEFFTLCTKHILLTLETFGKKTRQSSPIPSLPFLFFLKCYPNILLMFVDLWGNFYAVCRMVAGRFINTSLDAEWFLVIFRSLLAKSNNRYCLAILCMMVLHYTLFAMVPWLFLWVPTLYIWNYLKMANSED